MGWLRDTFGGRGRAASPPAVVPRAGTAQHWRSRGNEALAAGRPAEAADCYAQGVKENPGDATLRLNLGFALLEQGNAAAAAESLTQALALRRPEDDFAHEAHFLLGRANADQNRLPDALAGFEAALRIRPDFFEAIDEGTRILHKLERHAEAAQWARRLATLRPSPFADLLVASQLSLAGDCEGALKLADAVREVEPTNAEASVVRFDALIKLGRNDEALVEARRTLELTRSSAAALVNAGVALQKVGRFDEALDSLEQALQRVPTFRDAFINKAAFLIAKLRVAEAADCAREGLRSHPDDADLHWHLAIASMLLGDMETGWRESEWRIRSSALRGKVLELSRPRWAGESLEGRTIFLHSEQGFGDSIQFVRFVPEIAARAKHVYLQVFEPLEPLVRDMAPNCQLLPQSGQLPPIDFYCSLLSLPAVLGTTEATIPARVPYLRADAGRVAAWKEKLGSATLNVGVAWAGLAKHVNDHNRSMTLETFRQACAPGCRFVTVQPELRERDSATLNGWPEAIDLGRELKDFADTAALVEALDLVVCVDTAVAHLAGALGKPVWILLPYAPDWRWMLAREDTPWYPTARLFRQPRIGEWAPVLARVRDELAAAAQASRVPASA